MLAKNCAHFANPQQPIGHGSDNRRIPRLADPRLLGRLFAGGGCSVGRAVCNGRHCHSVIDFDTSGLSPTASLRLDVALDALQRCFCWQKVNRLACVPGHEFDRCQGGGDGCRGFVVAVQVYQEAIDMFGRDLSGVEARGDLYECLVDVAGDFRGLVYSIDPVQKVRCVVTIRALGIESNGLKLKRLRCFGQWLSCGSCSMRCS